MKRPSPLSPATEQPAKRARSHLRDTLSARDEAEPYRLATAKFAIESLSPEWSFGKNRPLDEEHVKTLCHIFMREGIRRRERPDRLIVVCKKKDVDKMVQHVQMAAQGGEADYPSFHEWEAVIGAKAELAAGRHRVTALAEQIRRTKSSKEEGWWICDVYDIGPSTPVGGAKRD